MVINLGQWRCHKIATPTKNCSLPLLLHIEQEDSFYMDLVKYNSDVLLIYSWIFDDVKLIRLIRLNRLQ